MGDKLDVLTKVKNNISLAEIANSLSDQDKELIDDFSVRALIDRLAFFDDFEKDKILRTVKDRNSESSFAAGTISLMQKGSWTHSLVFLKEFLGLIEGKKLKETSSFKDFYDEIFSECVDEIDDIGKYFNLALVEIFYSHPEKALFYATLAADLTFELDLPEKIEARTIESLFYSSLNSSLADEKWKQTFALLDNMPEWERIGETRTIVKKIKGSNLLNRILIFKEATEELNCLSAESAVNNIFQMRKIKTHQSFYYFEDIDRAVYIMAYLDGETFLQQLEQGFKFYTLDIVDILFEIHNKIPTELCWTLSEENFYEEIKKRVYNSNLNLSEEVIKNLDEGYSFLTYLFFEYEDLWRFNKDAHPENWLITDYNEIRVLDMEVKYNCPVVFDLANLYGYGDYFSKKEMKEGIGRYFDQLEETAKDWGNNIIYPEFEFLFWNALIHRSFFLCSAWSDPNRSSLHEKRKDLIDNALMAVDVIKQDYSSAYNKNKSAYVALEKGFLGLKEHLEL